MVTVQLNVCVEVTPEVVALTLTEYVVLLAIGPLGLLASEAKVPEMKPVAVSMLIPLGRPVAEKVVVPFAPLKL